ncbi:MAG: hypothetical protein KJ734_03215, partial [Chloroflexi bacterium]|nr:hypothetical protein [Chloroflexota bacterium]
DPIAGAPAGIERAWPDLLVQVEVTGQPTSRMAWAVEVERAEYSTPRLVDKWVRDLYCYPFPLLIVTEPDQEKVQKIISTVGRAMSVVEGHYKKHGVGTPQPRREGYSPAVAIYTLAQLATYGLGTLNLVAKFHGPATQGVDNSSLYGVIPWFISRDLDRQRG